MFDFLDDVLDFADDCIDKIAEIEPLEVTATRELEELIEKLDRLFE